MKANAHKTLSQLRTASENTKMKSIIDAADQGLKMVEYETKKDARVISDTMKSAEEAVKYHLENDQKRLSIEAHKLQNVVDYQVNHTIKPNVAKIEAQAEQLAHTVKVLSHREKVDA